MPIIFEKLANGNGHNVAVSFVTKGKYTLYLQSKRPEVVEAIKTKNWDKIIIQGSSRDMLKDSIHFRTKTFPGLKNLFSQIRIYQPNANVSFFVTWPYLNGYKVKGVEHSRFGMYQLVEKGYENLAKKYHTSIIRVGKTWLNHLNANPHIPLYTKDKAHPSFYGSYLSACVFYTNIFNEDINGRFYKNRGLNPDLAIEIEKFVNKNR